MDFYNIYSYTGCTPQPFPTKNNALFLEPPPPLQGVSVASVVFVAFVAFWT